MTMSNASNGRAAVKFDEETLVVRIPMQLKRRVGRKTIIVPDGLPGAGRSSDATQEPLVTALGKAFHWQALLDGGQYRSVTVLAEALGADRSYVGRILRLATLAPDLVEAIVEGEEPSGLSLETLTKAMPLRWDEQRERFGFPARRPPGNS